MLNLLGKTNNYVTTNMLKTYYPHPFFSFLFLQIFYKFVYIWSGWKQMEPTPIFCSSAVSYFHRPVGPSLWIFWCYIFSVHWSWWNNLNCEWTADHGGFWWKEMDFAWNDLGQGIQHAMLIRFLFVDMVHYDQTPRWRRSGLERSPRKLIKVST